MTKLLYIPGVATLELDREKCTGCGMCAEVCPRGVFTLSKDRARIENRDACIECGACAMNCEPGALAVRSGVGCAAGVLAGMIRGTEPTCDCGCGPSC